MTDYHTASSAMEPFDDVLLTTKEAADLLAVSPSALVYWRSAGNGPQFIRAGARTILYRKSHILAFNASYWPSEAFRQKAVELRMRKKGIVVGQSGADNS